MFSQLTLFIAVNTAAQVGTYIYSQSGYFDILHFSNMQLAKLLLPSLAELVSCPARARLPARNGLVNKVEFLGLITQNG